jgi:undecaprenyl-diphosphatase
VLVLGAVASGTLASILLKLGFDRPRPDLVAQLAHAQSSSFPSGHAMLSAVTYLTLGVLLARAHARKRTKIFVMSFAIGLTLLIGMSRALSGCTAHRCWRAGRWVRRGRLCGG